MSVSVVSFSHLTNLNEKIYHISILILMFLYWGNHLLATKMLQHLDSNLFQLITLKKGKIQQSVFFFNIDKGRTSSLTMHRSLHDNPKLKIKTGTLA